MNSVSSRAQMTNANLIIEVWPLIGTLGAQKSIGLLVGVAVFRRAGHFVVCSWWINFGECGGCRLEGKG